MKELKIYSVDETPKPLLLRLACNGGGDVALIAVNGDGVELSGGRLITLTANGPVCLHKRVSKHLELPLDEDGRLKIAGREDKTAVTFSDDDLARMSVIKALLTARRERQSAEANIVESNLVLTVFERMIEHLNLTIDE